MSFADEAISVFGDWGFAGKPEMLVVTGDKKGDGSSILDLEAKAYLRFFCVLRLASESVTDILPRRAINEDTSTQPFASGLSFLTDVVILN